MGKDLKGREIGRGFTQRKDGRYAYRVMIDGERFEVCDTSLTKLRKKSKNPRLAEELATKDINSYTFKKWYEEWFQDFKSPMLKNDRNRHNYNKRLNRNYLKLIGNKNLKRITPQDMQKATNEMIAEGYNPSTVEQDFGIVRECFDVAVQMNLIQKNPCRIVRINLGYPAPTERRVMSAEEERIFFKAAEGSFYEDLFYTMALTGMRIGEISGLQIGDVDFRKKVVHVRRQLILYYEDGPHYEFSSPKTQRGFRDIPFFDGIEKHLKSQIKRRRGQTPKDPKFKDLLFLTKTRTPINKYNMTYMLDRVVKDINKTTEFERISPHTFRHTFCTRLFEKGLNPVAIQRIMGHASYQTTLAYTHTNDEFLRQEAAKAGDMFL